MVVDTIVRADCGDATAGQPRTWTLLEFRVDDDALDALAEKLSDLLDDRLGWYCDFRSRDETFVVFAGTVFRYHRGDRTGRARAAEHARSVGVPEAQLDWPE
jgi:hypothetical protein